MMTKIRQTQINEEAYDLWHGFLLQYAMAPVRHSHLTLLDPRQLRFSSGKPVKIPDVMSHPTALAFLHYCFQNMRNRPKPGILGKLKVVDKRLSTLVSSSKDNQNAKSGWAPHGLGIEIQIVHFSHFGKTALEGRRKFAKTLLHEAGHYLLHQSLIGSLKTPPIAEGWQEEEAWFFSGAVWEMAKAQKAHDQREANGFGEIWEDD